MTPDDLDDMAALLGDRDVMRHYPRPRTRDEALAWIDWNQRLYRREGFGLWLVTLRATGEFAGDCGLTPQEIDGAAEIEVGYHFRTDLQGRGRLPRPRPRRARREPPDRDHPPGQHPVPARRREDRPPPRTGYRVPLGPARLCARYCSVNGTAGEPRVPLTPARPAGTMAA
jgi:hypothetical protein